MSSYWQKPGIAHVGEYQTSGHAYYIFGVRAKGNHIS